MKITRSDKRLMVMGFVIFVRSSKLFWNAMEKQFVSRTRTTNNDLGKLQLLDKIFTSLHYMKITRSDNKSVNYSDFCDLKEQE